MPIGWENWECGSGTDNVVKRCDLVTSRCAHGHRCCNAQVFGIENAHETADIRARMFGEVDQARHELVVARRVLSCGICRRPKMGVRAALIDQPIT